MQCSTVFKCYYIVDLASVSRFVELSVVDTTENGESQVVHGRLEPQRAIMTRQKKL